MLLAWENTNDEIIAVNCMDVIISSIAFNLSFHLSFSYTFVMKS